MKISSWTALLIGFPETSVTSHRRTLRKISEERRSQLHRGTNMIIVMKGNLTWLLESLEFNPYPANVVNMVSFLIMPADGRWDLTLGF